MPEETFEVLDHIPDEVPPYSITSDGVNWAALDGWSMSNFMTGAVIADSEVLPFSEVTLEDAHVANGHLVDSLQWDELDMAVTVEMPGGGAFVALSTIDDGEVSTVMLPYGVFGEAFGAPPELRHAIAAKLAALVENETVDVFEGNMGWLLGGPPRPPLRDVKLRVLAGGDG